MTRDEIDELIKYLEENYHVECKIVPVEGWSVDGLIVTPTLEHKYLLHDSSIKELIINKLDKLDLIRF